MPLKASHVIFGVGALVLVGLLAAKRAAGFLSYYINKVGIRFEGFPIPAPILKLDVVAQNPSNELFVIRSIAGDAFIDNSKIGSVSMFQTINIPPNATATIPVEIRLSLTAVVSDLVNLIQSGSGIPKTIQLKGYVNANAVTSDLNLNYQIG